MMGWAAGADGCPGTGAELEDSSGTGPDAHSRLPPRPMARGNI